MQSMSGQNGSSLWTIPAEHAPGGVALLVLVVVLAAGWLVLRQAPAAPDNRRRRLRDRSVQLGITRMTGLVGLIVGAVVHLVLVPTHWGDDRTTALLFIVDTVLMIGAGVLLLRRSALGVPATVAILVGTALTYVAYLLTGRETADPVGLVTSGIELITGLAMVVPRGRRFAGPSTAARLAGAAVVAVLVLGIGAAGEPSVNMASASSGSAVSGGSDATGSMPGMNGMSGGSRSLSLPTVSAAGPIVWPVPSSDMDQEAGMQMVPATCGAGPSATQKAAAVGLVNSTVAATRQYQSFDAAEAAGYVPVTPLSGATVHLVQPNYYRTDSAIDPTRIQSLVYAHTINSGWVLIAGMYLLRPGESSPPQPGGCLTWWHEHTDLCFGPAGRVVGTDDGGPCAGGTTNKVTTPMLHVWLVPTPGGPLNPMPSAATVWKAANALGGSPTT